MNILDKYRNENQVSSSEHISAVSAFEKYVKEGSYDEKDLDYIVWHDFISICSKSGHISR